MLKKAGSYRSDVQKKSDSFSFLVFRVHDKGQTPPPSPGLTEYFSKTFSFWAHEFEKQPKFKKYDVLAFLKTLVLKPKTKSDIFYQKLASGVWRLPP